MVWVAMEAVATVVLALVGSSAGFMYQYRRWSESRKRGRFIEDVPLLDLPEHMDMIEKERQKKMSLYSDIEKLMAESSLNLRVADIIAFEQKHGKGFDTMSLREIRAWREELDGD